MSKPSDSELKLLRHLWRAERLSAREIHEAAGGDATWSYSSTRKTLAALIRDFARNILDTDEPIPAATFVNSKLIDEDEVEELEALLERLERENGKKGDGA